MELRPQEEQAAKLHSEPKPHGALAQVATSGKENPLAGGDGGGSGEPEFSGRVLHCQSIGDRMAGFRTRSALLKGRTFDVGGREETARQPRALAGERANQYRGQQPQSLTERNAVSIARYLTDPRRSLKQSS